MTFKLDSLIVTNVQCTRRSQCSWRARQGWGRLVTTQEEKEKEKEKEKKEKEKEEEEEEKERHHSSGVNYQVNKVGRGLSRGKDEEKTRGGEEERKKGRKGGRGEEGEREEGKGGLGTGHLILRRQILRTFHTQDISTPVFLVLRLFQTQTDI